jgi:single-stranded-DNA-specific exonuclease
VVTLDCGTTAFEALAGATAQGQQIIVVDHHVAQADLPPALGVINPNRRDQTSPAGDLAAVGVTFLVVIALNRTLRARGHFVRRPEPDLRGWLDLVALGTICDVVPLTGLNRALVAQGLKVAARGANPGLVALARASRIAWPPSAEHCAFALGPRLNAGGRTGSSHLAVELLTGEAPDAVAEIALRLDRLNEERRTLERRLLAAAEAQVAPALEQGAPLLIVIGDGWSPGVLGLVAARLAERYHRPSLAIGLAGGIGKGSGRSVAGFDLGGAVIAARQAGLLVHGGGHPMAAGLTVEAAKVAALQAFLVERIAGVPGLGRPVPPDLALDGALQVAGLSFELAERLLTMAPFGRGNPEPRFMLRHVRSRDVRQLNGAHVGCWLYDPAGGRCRAIAFRASDQPVGRALLQAAGAPLHLAGAIKLEAWQGEVRLSFHIEDAASG